MFTAKIKQLSKHTIAQIHTMLFIYDFWRKLSRNNQQIMVLAVDACLYRGLGAKQLLLVIKNTGSYNSFAPCPQIINMLNHVSK